MADFQVGNKVTVPVSLNSYWAGDGVVTAVYSSGSIGVKMLTGKAINNVGGFDADKLVRHTGMEILSLKRSTHRTGLKVYGKVLGESGTAYNVAYFRRPNFRGWICSCENFFFTMFAKKRNCKHLRFVRGQVGRFAASVK